GDDDLGRHLEIEGERPFVEAMYRDGVLISRIGRNDEVLKIRPPLAFQASDAEILVTKLGRIIAAL
ncbi:MAG: aspartate aminotransferase family protein, partial [Actinobacteria bacterium]|nr:aspartate aminotransferase family protein [Actinomycetota bacterium]